MEKLVLAHKQLVRDAKFEACTSDRHVHWSATRRITVHGNRDFLSRALENVVRNAVKYTAEETAVEIILEREEATALLRVSDRGPGVPEEQLADIFRPFYRVAEARDRKSGGTGIGLAIAEKTVTLHGGSIAARNLPRGGLEVEIRLPQC
ncbi:ATP-binding protein [Geomonas terrae]|nr:ATP-binding protein [Geomonas terrae]